MVDGQSKILARLSPGAAAETLLYQVPLSQTGFVQGLMVCNRSAVPTSFRVSISFRGGPTAATDYLYYDLPIVGNDTFLVQLDTRLQATDVIRVYATLATLTFTLYGGPR